VLIWRDITDAGPADGSAAIQSQHAIESDPCAAVVQLPTERRAHEAPSNTAQRIGADPPIIVWCPALVIASPS